ncbi:MAG: hypothetical protein ACJAU6_003637 [Alphaproteobacteria bacterium]
MEEVIDIIFDLDTDFLFNFNIQINNDEFGWGMNFDLW